MLYNVPVEQRHTHDCGHCVYRGSSWSAPGRQHDWYTCLSGAGGNSLIRRDSSEPSDYHSVALFGESAEFDFVRYALRAGILRIVVNDDFKPEEE